METTKSSEWSGRGHRLKISDQVYEKETFQSFERIYGPNFDEDGEAKDWYENRVKRVLDVLDDSGFQDHPETTVEMEGANSPDSKSKYSPLLNTNGQYLRWDYDWRNHLGVKKFDKIENRNYHVMMARQGRDKWLEQVGRDFADFSKHFDLRNEKLVMDNPGIEQNVDWVELHPIIDNLVYLPKTPNETLLANTLKFVCLQGQKLAEEKAAAEHLMNVYKKRSDAFKQYLLTVHDPADDEYGDEGGEEERPNETVKPEPAKKREREQENYFTFPGRR